MFDTRPVSVQVKFLQSLFDLYSLLYCVSIRSFKEIPLDGDTQFIPPMRIEFLYLLSAQDSIKVLYSSYKATFKHTIGSDKQADGNLHRFRTSCSDIKGITENS